MARPLRSRPHAGSTFFVTEGEASSSPRVPSTSTKGGSSPMAPAPWMYFPGKAAFFNTWTSSAAETPQRRRTTSSSAHAAEASGRRPSCCSPALLPADVFLDALDVPATKGFHFAAQFEVPADRVVAEDAVAV